MPTRTVSASLVLHAVLAAWLLAELWFFGTPPEPKRKPLTITSEIQQEMAAIPEEVSPESSPPELEAEPDAPEPKILDDTVIPAPWFRPRDDTSLPRELLPRASSEEGDLAKPLRRKVAKVEKPKVVEPKKAEPAQERPSQPSRPAVQRQGATKKNLDCPSPIYPAAALRRGHEGRVILIVDVDEQGDVISMTLQTSSGYDSLDRAAMEAVKNWHFSPAEEGGKPVRDRIRVPITFRLPR